MNTRCAFYKCKILVNISEFYRLLFASFLFFMTSDSSVSDDTPPCRACSLGIPCLDKSKNFLKNTRKNLHKYSPV